jgi:hypothetical protein
MAFTVWCLFLYVALMLAVFGFLVLPLLRGTKSLLEQ